MLFDPSAFSNLTQSQHFDVLQMFFPTVCILALKSPSESLNVIPKDVLIGLKSGGVKPMSYSVIIICKFEKKKILMKQLAQSVY